MVCSADDLVVWRDFPKGLRVLLLGGDATSAADTKMKLESMDYIVLSYCNENEALEAISKKAESVHVAIIEVTSSNTHGCFRFLEMAKELPTIAISDVHCLSTMMKCIALGAAEFLQKPLSEEKLRNIWQHVVHKAFNAGGKDISKSLQPIKETVVSMLQLQSGKAEPKAEIPIETEIMEKDQGSKLDTSEENDKFPAPSTPQLVKGGRSADDGCCQDLPNCLTVECNLDDSMDLIEEREDSHSKFVDSTTNNLPHSADSHSKLVDSTTNNLPHSADSRKKVLKSNHTKDAAEEEVASDSGSKTDECSSIKDCQPSSDGHIGDNIDSIMEVHIKKRPFPCSSHLHGKKSNKRKMKVDWTPDLHRKFVKAVEQLGIDQAIPSKILELMKVEGLTRHNIASHLQKYRLHRRHILPKDDDKGWLPHRDSLSRAYMQKPVMLVPPFHSGCLPPGQIYPFWGHPSYYSSSNQTWGPIGFPPWHPPQGSWLWKTNPRVYAEAWGCPVGPPYGQIGIPSQNTTLSNDLSANGVGNKLSNDSYDSNLAEEVIDKVVKEAMSKPWLPLPLGLKPPSVDAVLVELHRQGIRTMPSSAPHTRS